MITTEETRKRLELSEQISSQLRGISQGISLGGSMGFGQDYSVNSSSDINLSVVCEREKLQELARTDYFLDNKLFFKIKADAMLPTAE